MFVKCIFSSNATEPYISIFSIISIAEKGAFAFVSVFFKTFVAITLASMKKIYQKIFGKKIDIFLFKNSGKIHAHTKV